MASFVDNIIGKVSSGVAQASGIKQAFDAQGKQFQKKVDSTVEMAEMYAAGTLAFQALAAFAALGILVLHIKHYHEKHAARPAGLNPKKARNNKNKRSRN